jgi:hypothetical protein
MSHFPHISTNVFVVLRVGSQPHIQTSKLGDRPLPAYLYTYVHKFALYVRPSVFVLRSASGKLMLTQEMCSFWKAPLILIANFAVAKIVSGQSQFCPTRKKARIFQSQFLSVF